MAVANAIHSCPAIHIDIHVLPGKADDEIVIPRPTF